MDIGKWTNIAIMVLMIVGVGAVIMSYGKGKNSLAKTVGFVVMFLGVAIDVGLPIVVPSLAGLADKLSYLTGIGAFILIGTMLLERRAGAKSS